MKRIIKFRGKDIKTGEFVFGDLETRPREDFMVIHQYNEDGSYRSQVKVDPDTVGQFTGSVANSMMAISSLSMIGLSMRGIARE